MGSNTSRPIKEDPKGMKNVFQAGIGTAETILGFPKTFKTLLIVGATVTILVVVVVVGTAAWGVGSGKIDVNQLADTASRTAIESSKNMPAVIPI